jgi:hypothetical protein
VDPASKVELLSVLVLSVLACQAMYVLISGWREDLRIHKDPPVRLSLWRRLRIALNLGRLQSWSWSPAQATVKQVFLTRHDTLATVVSLPKLGSRVVHPYKRQRQYSFGIWYRYEVGSSTYWGRQRSYLRYNSEIEARQSADALVGTEMPIRYDPSLPEDSRPVSMLN